MSAVRYCATEEAAERAVVVLEAIIDGVRNSNQAAENAAVKAAAAPELYAELQQFVNGVETRMIDSPADETLENITRRAMAALAKARGETL